MALLLAGVASGATIYVDASATGLNNGTSWANAFNERQSALAVDASGDEIWVAAGTWLPDYDVGTGTHTGSRSATLNLSIGVALYGGFPPGGGDGTFAARDPV
jgi:hypothetical protein